MCVCVVVGGGGYTHTSIHISIQQTFEYWTSSTYSGPMNLVRRSVCISFS